MSVEASAMDRGRVFGAARAVVLALAEILVASHVFMHYATHSDYGESPGIVYATPLWWNLVTPRFGVPLFVVVRRAIRYRRGKGTSVLGEALMASVVCFACMGIDLVGSWDLFVAAMRMEATLALAQGSTVVCVAYAFDLFGALPRTRAHVVFGVAMLLALFAIHRHAASSAIIAFVADASSHHGAVGLVALASFAVFALVRASRGPGLDERESLEALVLSLGATLLHAWCFFIYRSPALALTLGSAIVWLVPLCFALIALTFAPALRGRTRHVLASGLAAWLVLFVVDRSLPTRTARGVSLTVGERDAPGRPESCTNERAADILPMWRVLHPHDVPGEVRVWVHPGATDDDFARCVAALDASPITRVAIYRAMSTPLPWWSAMHTFAKANRPFVRVLEGPVSMLRGP